MIKSTLCYIENNGAYLMLYRNRKTADPNVGKWIGVGGKVEACETALECVAREVYEETGLSGLDYQYRGIVHFRSDCWDDEDMYLYTAQLDSENSFNYQNIITNYDNNNIADCDEGELHWIPKDNVLDLNLWEGDKYFLEKLLSNAETSPFEITLKYQGDKLVAHTMRLP